MTINSKIYYVSESALENEKRDGRREGWVRREHNIVML